MKLTAFQSDKGDCLMLETSDGKHRMLVDGGMSGSYSEHVAPAMGKLRNTGKKIDIVYVSHTDQDHISGVLQMLDDEAAWRVHEHHISNGNPAHPKPRNPRPPDIGQIWHNSFHDTIGRNSVAIERMLAATSEILSGADDPWLREIANDRRDLAVSIPEAMRVSRRIKEKQLNIPLNPEFDGKLMMISDDQPSIELGAVVLKLIGPTAKDLRAYRKEWNDWLRENQDTVKKIRAQAKADESELSQSGVDFLIGPMLREAQALGEFEFQLAKRLGSRKAVTAPNLASLMFLAEENGQTVLLTGDGHWEDILKGLEHQNAFDAGGKLHVSVLKVQHHGAEHNWHGDFSKRVTADRYVFCGNGEHENPEIDVIQEIFDSRARMDNRPYRFFFNSSSQVSRSAKGARQMRKIEDLVERLQTQSSGRLSSRFITGSSMKVL